MQRKSKSNAFDDNFQELLKQLMANEQLSRLLCQLNTKWKLEVKKHG
jgi:hypothetical protein